jgi:hypothetical protein
MRVMEPAWILGLAGSLVACTVGHPAPTSTAEATEVDRPTEAGELVLRVESRGGLLPPLERERQLPIISIYGDGLVLVPAEVPDIFPGPAGYTLDSFRIDGTTIDQIVTAGISIGLHGPERHLPQEGPDFEVDGGATVVTLVAGGQRHVTTGDALFDSSTSTPERQRLGEFLERLARLGGAERDPYEPDAYRVFVGAADPGFGADPEAGPPAEWPFDEALASWGDPLPADGLTIDARCRVMPADDLVTELPVLQSATVTTLVVDEAGDEAIVAYRPLLPDEASC